MQFEELNIIEPILRALKDKNYTTPTPIQQKAIPVVLAKKDMLGCAQTGTGKTAAFSIPIIQHVHEEMIKNPKSKKDLLALIITPTRELAIQIGENIQEYSKYTDVHHTVIYGGVKQGNQVNRLKTGVNILIATTGRLMDLMGQGFINLQKVKYFVLDEADRMLDMGFIHDIKQLLRVLPDNRQSLFFSATMPEAIDTLSKTILRNPTKIEVAPISSTAETIQQQLYYTNSNSKMSLLLHILQNKDMQQVLLFAKTKHGSDRITKNLRAENIDAAAIHGDKSQVQRQNALDKFKSGQLRILVATDIAARGIDIDKLKYVINYDIPNLEETYVHRIGRSGRAGESGHAISICEPEENDFIKAIEKLINKKIPVVAQHPYPQTERPMTEAERKAHNILKDQRKREMIEARRKNTTNNGRGNERPNRK